MPAAVQHEEVQIGGTGSVSNKVAIGLGAIGTIAGIAALFFEPIVAVLCLLVAVPLLLIGSIIALVRFRRRAWIRDTGDGFIYRDAASSQQFSDEEAIGIQVLAKNNYQQGVLKSVTRKVNLKVSGRETPLHLVHTVKINQVDPLGAFLHRTVESYRQRATDALDAGARLNGVGWSLGRDDLSIGTNNETRIPLKELVAIDSIDRKHNVWRQGDDHPCLSVTEDSENAFLLELLLRPRIIEYRKDQPFDIHEPGLGRQLFQRAVGPVARFFANLALWGGLLLLLGGIGAFASLAPDVIALGIVLFIVALIFMPLGFALKRADFRCHERGVYKKSMFSERELRFEDVESFTYSATRMYYNGAYTGTALNMKFVPLAGTGKKKLSYSRTVQNADEALDTLRDHVSRVLVIRLAETFASTGSLQWLPSVRISREGFHYRPQGLLGRKEEELLRFEEMLGFDIQEGTFHVWKQGVKKSVIHESVGQPNFFPGYYLLNSMFSAQA